MSTPTVRPEASATITVTEPVIVVPAHDVEHPDEYGWVEHPDEWVPEAGHWEPQADTWELITPAWTEHVPAVTTLTPELAISEGKVRLNENYSPYVTANFTVPLTSRDIVEQIDPRDNQRVTITTTEGVSGVERAYDLGLRSRKVDHKSQTVDIELASDEILLHDRRNVSTTVDTTPRTHEASLRALVNYVLGKAIPGAALEPGAADANLTAAWPATNLIHNGNARTDTADWGTTLSGGVAGSIWRGVSTTSLDGAQVGARVALNVTTTGTGLACLRYGNSATTNIKGIRPGAPYTIRVGVYHTNGNARTARVWIGYKDDQNKTIRSHSRTMILASNTWGIFEFTTFAPAGASQAALEFGVEDGLSAGKYVTVGAPTFIEGTEVGSWFDYGRANDNLYAYALDGDTAGAGPSTRTPYVERLPELFGWKPGQSLFDFLQPLLAASGLRLFCDENRVWRLVDPEEYEVPGYVVAQAGHNATEGTDEITRNDDTWADAVVVAYTWTGRDGETQTAYDAAGDPNGKTILRELDHEYPGPGAAAFILNSFTGRGRTQNVTVLGQYGATPGQTVTISLPGAFPQTGKVRAVTFDLKSGLMELETRGLIDTLPGSWALWDPAETWSEVTPTLAWKDA